jgi:plastocyanin
MNRAVGRSTAIAMASLLLVAALPMHALGAASGIGATGPAQVVGGSCVAPGDVLATLDGAPLATGSAFVGASIGTVEMGLGTLLASPHALLVGSADPAAAVLACGDLMGSLTTSGDLVASVSQQDGSGLTGLAFLHGDASTTSVYLALVGLPAAPAVSPAPAAAVSATVRDFEFQPNPLLIAVGTTVTWTSSGPSSHTVAADDGSFSSGVLATGATFSHTFGTAGTFAYHCEIHPDMRAVITAS